MPGRPKDEPGIQDREYGFRVCASKSAVADLDNDSAELGKPEFGRRIPE
jgi:hypothetical protein